MSEGAQQRLRRGSSADEKKAQAEAAALEQQLQADADSLNASVSPPVCERASTSAAALHPSEFDEKEPAHAGDSDALDRRDDSQGQWDAGAGCVKVESPTSEPAGGGGADAPHFQNDRAEQEQGKRMEELVGEHALLEEERGGDGDGSEFALQQACLATPDGCSSSAEAAGSCSDEDAGSGSGSSESSHPEPLFGGELGVRSLPAYSSVQLEEESAELDASSCSASTGGSQQPFKAAARAPPAAAHNGAAGPLQRRRSARSTAEPHATPVHVASEWLPSSAPLPSTAFSAAAAGDSTPPAAIASFRLSSRNRSSVRRGAYLAFC
jgi:hypothetical protein